MKSAKACKDRLGKKLWELLEPLLRLSLFWKMGVVIGACVVVNSIMAIYLYYQLKRTYFHLIDSPGYIYESMAREGLLYLENLKHLNPSSPDFVYNLSVLEIMLRHAVKGGVYRVSSQNNGDIIFEFPSKVKQLSIYPLLEDAYQRVEKLLTDRSLSPKTVANEFEAIEKDFNQILSWGFHTQYSFRKHLEKLFVQTARLKWVIGGVLAFFMIWGAVAFIAMVVIPLRRVAERIRGLTRGELAYRCLDDPESCHLSYYANDEIGNLTNAVNELIGKYSALSTFKHLIEEDEEVDEIYGRLAHVFKELGLETFVIFSVSNSQNTMQVIYSSPEDLEVNAEKLINANLCRAKRTGHIVSSLEAPRICKMFLWSDEADHFCIPMMYGGQCVGVVQFLLPPESSVRKRKSIQEKLRLAQEYIEETVPVLEAKRYAATLKEQSMKDALTDLYNRRFLEATLDTLVAGILRRKTTMGILMADLDYFKSVNDKYGHDVGDLILKETARILKSNVRQSDLVIRFGGEEFLILLIDCRDGESVRIAEKLRAAVEAHKFEVPGGTIQRTISIGVSEFPTDAQGIWEAIKYADVALYKAKEMGRNRVVRFTPDMWPLEEY
ncbi:GGDEF domain-containing protein [Thermosulfurimonas sp. F29]|uniref:GGDEF domain-containing protein n=1 Tax=Thermosulfurimonas sp. F29 TaxID=2867247 RepID=UPI001C82DBCC|nr:GGDEF domain-containing protein [Thermosulfurimonas sp. F29]MBX6424009.1 GGDEF domain-containing protein [Thermosulfurimonas sp. F29]